MKTQKIALITDSTNDLPQDLREKYGIKVVPLTIVWGDEQYLDGIDIQPEAFYQRLGVDPKHPTTSQPTPADFLVAYESAINDGAQEIIVATISSAMSGTFESARIASQDYAIPVHLVDSKSNSMSLGWQVLAMARARESGATTAEMIQEADEVRNQLHYHIVLDTLEYLFKGGRIAGAAKFLNNVIKIKPQIRVNHQSGTVEPGDVSRTRVRALESVYSSFFKKLDVTKPMRVAVLHNAALEEATVLAQKVKEEFNPVELMIGIVSPVLGVHTGPHAIALCGYSEP
jgi:DegV family protein with EDD domain